MRRVYEHELHRFMVEHEAIGRAWAGFVVIFLFWPVLVPGSLVCWLLAKLTNRGVFSLRAEWREMRRLFVWLLAVAFLPRG